MYIENPADDAIAELIKKLAKEASSWTNSEETRDKAVEKIAVLRASMNPTIECTK